MDGQETPAQMRRRIAREEHERLGRERRASYIAAAVATIPPLTETERLEFRELLRPVRSAAHTKRRDVA